MAGMLQSQGFSEVEGVLSKDEARQWIDFLGEVEGAGRRGLLRQPEVAALARSDRLLTLLRPHLEDEPRAVRAIYFDKSPAANWLVAWHQDLTLAVQERREVAGFGPWSEKDGIPHVQPPARLLEQMLTIRIHLDHADETNGALRVLPGTHNLGRLTAGRIQQLRAEVPEHLCEASAGDALLMRPLLLHASGRSNTDRHRRILHIEYAAFDLPGGLRWMDG